MIPLPIWGDGMGLCVCVCVGGWGGAFGLGGMQDGGRGEEQELLFF